MPEAHHRIQPRATRHTAPALARRHSIKLAVRGILQTSVFQPAPERGAANDPAETEADHIADRVMRMPEPIAARPNAERPPGTSGRAAYVTSLRARTFEFTSGEFEARPVMR